LTLKFIKTPNSWLFHITKICNLEYNVEKSQNKITIQYITFLIFQKIYTTIWTLKSLQKSALLNFIVKQKLHSNCSKIPCFMEMKSNNKIKSVIFYYQVPTTLPTSSKLCPSKKSSSSSPNLPSLGNPK
jgi:hypothetical protein